MQQTRISRFNKHVESTPVSHKSISRIQIAHKNAWTRHEPPYPTYRCSRSHGWCDSHRASRDVRQEQGVGNVSQVLCYRWSARKTWWVISRGRAALLRFYGIRYYRLRKLLCMLWVTVLAYGVSVNCNCALQELNLMSSVNKHFLQFMSVLFCRNL